MYQMQLSSSYLACYQMLRLRGRAEPLSIWMPPLQHFSQRSFKASFASNADYQNHSIVPLRLRLLSTKGSGRHSHPRFSSLTWASVLTRSWSRPTWADVMIYNRQATAARLARIASIVHIKTLIWRRRWRTYPGCSVIENQRRGSRESSGAAASRSLASPSGYTSEPLTRSCCLRTA